ASSRTRWTRRTSGRPRRTPGCGRAERASRTCPADADSTGAPRLARGPLAAYTLAFFPPARHRSGCPHVRQRTETLAAAHDPRARAVLGRARVRDPAAVPVRGGRGHVQPGDVPALARARAVAGRLRRAVPPSEGRALRREPEPLPAVLPVPGAAEARTGRRRGRLLPVAGGDGTRSAEARPAAGRGRLGEPDARGRGPGLAGVVRRHRDL